MEDKHRLETRQYAWNYFALHADQRLKTFNFYLLLATVILGGLLAYLRDAKTPWYAFPAGLLLTLLSYVFWRLDGRNRELIRHAEDILKDIEKDVPPEAVPEALRLIAGEDRKTEDLKDRQGQLSWSPVTWWHAHFSYSSCLTVVFWTLGILGLVIAVGVFWIPATQPSGLTPMTQQFFIGSQPVIPSAQNQP